MASASRGGNHLLDKGSRNGDVILELGQLRAVLRIGHGQQALSLVVHDQQSFGACLLSIVSLHPPALSGFPHFGFTMVVSLMVGASDSIKLHILDVSIHARP